MSQTHKPWPYFLLVPEAMVRVLERQPMASDTTESPLAAIARPNVLKTLFSHEDLVKLYWLNTSSALSIRAAKVAAPCFFTTFWGNELVDEIKPLASMLDAQATQNQSCVTDGTQADIQFKECMIPSMLKPTQASDDADVYPEEIILLPVADSIIPNLTVTAQTHPDNDGVKAVITSALKALYRLYSVEQVAHHPWFPVYVSRL